MEENRFFGIDCTLGHHYGQTSYAMTKWFGTVVILPIEIHQQQGYGQWIYRLASRMSQSRENRQKFKNSFFLLR